MSGKYSTLEILNTKDKNGEMIEESYSMDGEGEEEGELDMLDNMGLNLKTGELSREDLKNFGIIKGQGDLEDDYSELFDEEQGEFEQEKGELELDEDGLNKTRQVRESMMAEVQTLVARKNKRIIVVTMIEKYTLTCKIVYNSPSSILIKT